MNSPSPHDPQGPKDGDFVGYLKQLEQNQAARLHLPHSPPETTSTSIEERASITRDTPLNPLVPEHRALLRARFAEAQKKSGPLGVLQLIQAVIGAALLIASLSEDGNIIMLVIGIGLMWVPLARMQRLLHALNPKAPPASLQNLFGKSKKP